MTDFRVGDKVKVTIIGTVTAGLDDDHEILVEWDGGAQDIFANPDNDDVTVEVIERAAEKFGVGDVVRFNSSDNIYTVMSNNRLFSHSQGKVIEYPFRVESPRFTKVAGND